MLCTCCTQQLAAWNDLAELDCHSNGLADANGYWLVLCSPLHKSVARAFAKTGKQPLQGKTEFHRPHATSLWDEPVRFRLIS